MKWIDAGATADLHDGQAISIPVGRRMIAVVRSGEEFFDIEDVCTHDGAELTGGNVEGTEIICPRHGARFCLRRRGAIRRQSFPDSHDAVSRGKARAPVMASQKATNSSR